jgi:uncharacterized damage-inducible protein DinB
MIVSYFQKLFEYDDWANQRVLDALDGLKEKEEKLKKITAHLFMAQRIWLSRMIPDKVSMPSSAELEPGGYRSAAGELKNCWDEYLPSLTEEKLASKIAYKSLKGVAFETSLVDILTQLIIHGSYHRGQIASLIKKAGGTPPETDYIVFARK